MHPALDQWRGNKCKRGKTQANPHHHPEQVLVLGGGGGPTATSATLEVRFGEGPKPDDPNAYDARSIATNLRARQASK